MTQFSETHRLIHQRKRNKTKRNILRIGKRVCGAMYAVISPANSIISYGWNMWFNYLEWCCCFQSDKEWERERRKPNKINRPKISAVVHSQGAPPSGASNKCCIAPIQSYFSLWRTANAERSDQFRWIGVYSLFYNKMMMMHALMHAFNISTSILWFKKRKRERMKEKH